MSLLSLRVLWFEALCRDAERIHDFYAQVCSCALMYWPPAGCAQYQIFSGGAVPTEALSLVLSDAPAELRASTHWRGDPATPDVDPKRHQRPPTDSVVLANFAVGALAMCACGGGAATPAFPAPAPAPVVAPALPVAITPALPPVKPPAPRAAVRRAWAALDTGALSVPIFAATLRRPVVSDRPGDKFGGDDADSLLFALVKVNVPGYAVRRQGETPRPPTTRVSRFWYKPDSTKDMYLRDVAGTDATNFARAVTDALTATQSRSLLIFVHGYNVSFEDAAVRAAQIAADTDLDGAVVIFDWPSAGAMSSYVRDQQAARNAGFYLARFLRDFPASVDADRLLLVAHSMGSEVVSRAVSILGDSVPPITQAVFAAPDVDARFFRREVLPRLVPKAKRITVYASNEDEALRASRVLNGVWRLGLGGDSLVVLKDMDTIDATRVRGDFLGHTLFINGSVLADLHELLANDRAPGDRRLLGIRKDSLTFWRFRSESR